jgi:hypothetical protein
MKKIIVAGLVALAGFTALNAEAHDWHRGGYYRGGYYRGGCWNCGSWVAPALIGGVIGYELGQPRYGSPVTTTVYPSTPIYQNCTAWIETIDQYGHIVRTRTCY